MTTFSTYVTTEIKWTVEEIEDCIFGSGALTYPWWAGCEQLEPGRYRITAVDPDYPDDEDAWSSVEFTAGLFAYTVGVVAKKYTWHTQSIIDQDLDADLVNTVLQTIVLGEVVYG